MRNRLSFRVAFCGVLAALMIAVMLLGTMIPTTTYICPALAGVLLLPVVWEFGFRTGALLYLAVALLSLILSPNKEAALFFVLLFGWYPLLRPKLQHLRRKPWRIILKLSSSTCLGSHFRAPAVCVCHARPPGRGTDLDRPGSGWNASAG